MLKLQSKLFDISFPFASWHKVIYLHSCPFSHHDEFSTPYLPLRAPRPFHPSPRWGRLYAWYPRLLGRAWICVRGRLWSRPRCSLQFRLLWLWWHKCPLTPVGMQLRYTTHRWLLLDGSSSIVSGENFVGRIGIGELTAICDSLTKRKHVPSSHLISSFRCLHHIRSRLNHTVTRRACHLQSPYWLGTTRSSCSLVNRVTILASFISNICYLVVWLYVH